MSTRFRSTQPNPCSNLDLPAVRGRRERIPSPQEAAALLAALPEPDRALWATALYAGLRRGELLALQWDDIDPANGVIRVRRALDARGTIISPKSAAGISAVPVAKVLRAYGHLFSVNEEEAAALGDAYLDRIAARRDPLA